MRGCEVVRSLLMRQAGIVSSAKYCGEVNALKVTTIRTQPAFKIRNGNRMATKRHIEVAFMSPSGWLQLVAARISRSVGHKSDMPKVFLFSKSTHWEYENVRGPG